MKELNYQHKGWLALWSARLKGAAIFSILMLGQLCVNAQTGTVTGTVNGSDGRPLAGVSVNVKGTSRGTSTNSSGKFSIAAASTDSLVLSSVGFQQQTIAVGNQTDVSVSLTATNRELEQVVVTGYGTARKRDITGAVATVSGAELAKQPVLTATQAVQGKVAGVQVISSGDPNALPVIRIRGTGTMLAGANPLYVVDGVINDDIRNINSSDIVSMEILKSIGSIVKTSLQKPLISKLIDCSTLIPRCIK